MKRIQLIIGLFTILFTSCNENRIKIEKPQNAKIEPIEEVYFGKHIIDNYRYMENLKDTTVIDWITAQSNYARKVLNNISGRQELIDKMIEFDSRRASDISQLKIAENDRYFYLKQTPDDETGKLYYRDGIEGEEFLLFDPFTYDTVSTKKYVVNGISPSYDGNKIAIGITEGGAENVTILIMNVKTKSFYPEKISNCWAEADLWLPDNESFTYLPLNSGDVTDTEARTDLKAKLHLVGTSSKNDKVVFSRSKYPNLIEHSSEIPWIEYNKESGYIFGYVVSGEILEIYYAPGSTIDNKKIPWVPLIKPIDQIYDFKIKGDDIYLYSAKNAPNFKIIKTSLKNPDIENAEELVSEDENALLKSFELTSDGLYYTLSVNGVEEKLYFQAYNSKTPVELNLPFNAGVIYLKTKGVDFSDVWVTIAGWTNDYQRYKYLPESNEFRVENLSPSREFPEFKDFISEELMIESHDSVRVPLSLVYKKGIKLNAENPVLIFGYGGFGVSIEPFFWKEILLWVEKGGIFAVAHVRGGRELGEEWHKGGMKTTKPNTWKDLISCSEYLIKESYTSKEHLAIWGGSNGGILVGRAMTERPDLFAAVIAEVGLMNPVRFEFTPNGPGNIYELGTVNDSIECMALIEMDAYHHLQKDVKYPATLITAGMNDPRLIAWQPAKFAAQLLEYNVSENPVLFFTDFERAME